MLEYRLTDALEMHYSRNQKVLEAIKCKLLGHPIRDFNLYPLLSFALENALVVVQNGNPKRIKQFYLLNAHRESFQTFRIDPRGTILKSTGSLNANGNGKKTQNARKSKKD